MGIVYAPVTDAGVTAEDLVTTELACVVPKAHALARKRVVKPEDLASETVISLGATTRIGLVIEEECRKAGVPVPDVGIEASSSLAACLMVSEGAGIGLVDGGVVAVEQVQRPRVPAFRAAHHARGEAHLHARPPPVARGGAVVGACFAAA